MHALLNNLHSWNRYLILIALVLVLFRSISGWLGRKPFVKADGTASLILMILSDVQLLVGLILYAAYSGYTTPYLSNMGAAMHEPWARYFTVEHGLSMIIAIALIHIGRSMSKKATDPVEQHRKLAIYTGIAALVIIGTLAMKGLLLGTLASAMGG